MEVILTVGERVITVTADRQQIMELLFSTFEDVKPEPRRTGHRQPGLRAARAEADRANHAKSQFLSRMSHELRTPLNAVMGFGQLLEMATLGSDDQESVRMIMAAGRHLLDLVDEVLDIGRIDAGELTLRLESVRAGDVIQEAIDLVRPLAASRSIRLRSDVDGSAVAVIADHQRLKQVILNLMSNAVKYNRWGGTVTVACRQGDNGRICIEVVDTGPGIASQDLDRLFAPFDRLGVEQDTSVQGTGLGLALSKRLVEAMGGILSVESESGSGSTFASAPAGRSRRSQAAILGRHRRWGKSPGLGSGLTWYVATDSHSPPANIQRVIPLAQDAVTKTAEKDALSLDALAAALARAGRYDQAAAIAQQAIACAQGQNQPKLVRAISSQLQHYQQGEPYIEGRGQNNGAITVPGD